MKYKDYPHPLRKILCDALTTIFLFPSPYLRYLIRNALYYTSPWHLIKTWYSYRFQQPDNLKYYFSIAMCVRDEGDYIQEWLEYYLLQGVEHFYIYNNNGTDNTPQIIKKYIDAGLVSWIEYPGRKKQIEIYNHAINNFKNETRWLGFIDCDEFIVPHQDKTVAEYLHKYEKFNQLLIHWVIFGSSGHLKKTPGLVIERFTERQQTTSHLCKSIVNPRAVVYTNIHWSIVLGYATNETGEILYKNKSHHPVSNIIQINHYMVKSLEEYNKKVNRQRAYSASYEDNYFQNANLNNIPDNNPYLKTCAELIKKRLES